VKIFQFDTLSLHHFLNRSVIPDYLYADPEEKWFSAKFLDPQANLNQDNVRLAEIECLNENILDEETNPTSQTQFSINTMNMVKVQSHDGGSRGLRVATECFMEKTNRGEFHQSKSTVQSKLSKIVCFTQVI
jgi:hypothetical protein